MTDFHVELPALLVRHRLARLVHERAQAEFEQLEEVARIRARPKRLPRRSQGFNPWE